MADDAKKDDGPAIKTGVELLLKLKDSFTGESKLEVGRELLRRNPDCTSAEMVNHFRQSGRVPDGTIEKAVQFMQTGEYRPVAVQAVLPIEEQIAFMKGIRRDKAVTPLGVPQTLKPENPGVVTSQPSDPKFPHRAETSTPASNLAPDQKPEDSVPSGIPVANPAQPAASMSIPNPINPATRVREPKDKK